MSSCAPAATTLTAPAPINLAAGQVNKQVVAHLLHEIPVTYVMGKIRTMLDATITTKAGTGPDFRAMEAGSKLWTTIIALDAKNAASDPALNSGNVEGLEDRMMRSPALREMVRGMLERAESYAAATSPMAKGREVVDVPEKQAC